MELPPFRITATIYGISQQQFTSVTNCSTVNAVDILNNICILKSKEIIITAQTPINKLTKPEFIMISEWCYLHDIKYKSSNELTDSYYGDDNKKLAVSDEDFRSLQAVTRKITGTNAEPYIPKQIFGYKYHFDCKSGKHTFVISYDYKLRPCFVYFGVGSKSFSAQESMKDALDKMILYLESSKKEIIKFCNGCTAVDICNECAYTQQNNRQHLEEYMSAKCMSNQRKLHDYLAK
jgi:radical SAM protein with 4Fe4S-binding SPASM domain